MPDHAIAGLPNGGLRKFPLKCLQLLKIHDVPGWIQRAQKADRQALMPLTLKSLFSPDSRDELLNKACHVALIV
jgi:hypothetical protein